MKKLIHRIKKALPLNERKCIDDLLITVDKYCQEQIIDADAAHIISRILDVSNTQVRDIQTPKSRMIFFTLQHTIAQIIDTIRQTRHSRFLVLDNDEMKPIGIILTKDLLMSLLTVNIDQDMDEMTLTSFKELMHPCHVTPDSKRIDHLLREFRQEHAHMAAVINEYGAVCGLVTIEDIIEEIIGEIEDEKDQDEQYIVEVDENIYRLDASLEISTLNETLDSDFDESYFDTIGGLVAAQFDHIPQAGQSVIINNYLIKVISAQSRKVEKVEITRCLDSREQDKR